MNTTLVFDTETTGLLKPAAVPLAQQPYITEIFAYILDEDLKPIGEFETFLKPPVPIPDECVKITGITNEMVKDAPTFADIYDELVEFCMGVRTMVAHNLTFDRGMLRNELRRIGRELNFPWPPVHHCTVELSMHLEGKRLNLGKLYKKATGKEIEGAHRARNDVDALVECYRWLHAQRQN